MDFGKLLHSFSRVNVFLFAMGVFLLIMSTGDLVTIVKPARDFDYLMENGVEQGTHVKGNVYYTFDCFANEETWKENRDTGVKSESKISHYYYAIPISDDYVVGLEIPAKNFTDMEQLLDETVAYLDGGDYPATIVNVEGGVKLMDEDLRGYFTEYLLAVGYTQAEIDAMGTPLMITWIGAPRIIIGLFAASIVFIGLSIFLMVRRYKKQH